MYKVGKYEYGSRESYQKLVFAVLVIFFICAYLLVELKSNMNQLGFYFIFTVDVLMMFHLTFRLIFSKGYIKSYVFNEW